MISWGFMEIELDFIVISWDFIVISWDFIVISWVFYGDLVGSFSDFIGFIVISWDMNGIYHLVMSK